MASLPIANDMDERLTLYAIIDYHFDSQNAAPLRDLMEFDGPPWSKCEGVPYISFNQWGAREQGQNNAPAWDAKCWTEAEAIFRFRHEFFTHLITHPAKRLVWRDRPRIEQGPDGDWRVFARFALLEYADG